MGDIEVDDDGAAALVDAPSVRAHKPQRSGSQGSGRERILEVALQEFATRGFDGASTTEIARLAGVTQPLVHYHFATKDDLWKAVVREAFAELSRHRVDDGAGLGDLEPLDRIRVVMRRYVAFVAEHPELGRIIAHEGTVGGDRLAWMVEEELGARLRSLVDVLRDGIEAGVMKDLPAEYVAISFVAAAGYLFQMGELMERVYGLDVHDPDVVTTHGDTLSTIFLDGLRAAAPREHARA